MCDKLDKFLVSIGEIQAYRKCMPFRDGRWLITSGITLEHVIPGELIHISAEYIYMIQTTEDTVDEETDKYEDIVAEEIYNAIVKDGKINVEACKDGLHLTNIIKKDQP